MVRPVQRTILQGAGDILVDSGLEIVDVCISEPGIFEFADIETKLLDHRIEAGNSQLRVCASGVNLMATMITEKEIGN